MDQAACRPSTGRETPVRSDQLHSIHKFTCRRASAPVLDPSGFAVGAISIIALTPQMTDGRRMHAKGLLINATRAISMGSFS